MTRFIVRRLLLSIPVLFGVVVLVFILARIIPGDPCVATYGEKATEEVCDAFNQRWGLDKPIPEQFVVYLGGLLTGDLGMSLKFGRPVADVLLERLPTTVELTVAALIFASVLGLLLGLVSAIRRNSAADVGTMMIANIGVSIPVFVLGLILAFTFSVLLKGTPFALPPSGRLTPGVSVIPLATQWGLEDLTGLPRTVLDFVSRMYIFHAILTLDGKLFSDFVRHIILPAIAVGTIPLAIIARMTRSSLLEVLGLDFVRTARAKGVKERSVVLRHGLRNAMLPVVTVIGLSLGALLSGAVLTETIFGLTGMGQTLVELINGRDYSVIQGATIVVAVVYVVVNLVVDVSYAFLDPRIRARMTVIEQPATGAVVPPPNEKAASLRRDTARNILRQRSAVIGIIILGTLLAVAIFAPLIAPFDPYVSMLDTGETGIKRGQAPCIHLLGCPEDQPQHIMGLDSNLRDEFSRVVFGARVSLQVGILTVGFAILIGTALGAVAGFAGGSTDNLVMRTLDIVLAFPALILAIAIVTVLGSGLYQAQIAIAIVSIPIYARVMRGSVIATREREFVTASRALGESSRGILTRRIMPNSLTPLIVAGTLGIGGAILEVAALSFLGLGAQQPQAEWGSMIGFDRNLFFSAPHLIFFPGMAITLTVLGFNLLGDGLRDALDPRLNR